MKKPIVALMLLSWMLVMPCISHAQDNGLIILPFSGGDQAVGYEEMKQGWPDMLTSCLSVYDDRLVVLERAALEGAMGELGIRYDQIMDEETLPRLSKIQQAKFILKGSFFLNGDMMTVQANLYDVETTALLASVQSDMPENQLGKLCSDLAQKIAVKVSEYSDFKPLLIDETPEINAYFFEGLGHYYGAAYHKAIPAFFKILKLDPSHYEARYWLARCYEESSFKQSAKLEFEKLSQIKDHKRYQDVIDRINKLK